MSGKDCLECSTADEGGYDKGDDAGSMKHSSLTSNNNNYLNAWQGAALLTADCLGTGLLALPGDVHVLGRVMGLSFLILNLPINLYAGTILSHAATIVERNQDISIEISPVSQVSGLNKKDSGLSKDDKRGGNENDGGQIDDDDEKDRDNDDGRDVAVVEDDDDDEGFQQEHRGRRSRRRGRNSRSGRYQVVGTGAHEDHDEQQQSSTSSPSAATGLDVTDEAARRSSSSSSAVQHQDINNSDEATFDCIGMTRAVFDNRTATACVLTIYYVNLFLVLGSYILVMSHAVAAAVGEENICIPTAGLIASIGMFVVSQSRTMASLGRTASILSLLALFIVVLQCLYASQQQQQQQQEEEASELQADDGNSTGMGFANGTRRYTEQIGEDDDDESETLQEILDEEEGSEDGSRILRQFSALGSIGFAVGSQKLLLNIRHELADRSTSPRCLGTSLAAFGTFYVVIVLVAGSDPPPFLFDAIPPGGWNRRVAGLLLWSHVVVSYAINSQAICSSMDRLFCHRLSRLPMPSFLLAITGGVGGGGSSAAGPESNHAGITPAIRWFLLTLFMSVSAYTVANAVPFFKDLVGFIGAITSVPLNLIFPALFWRKCMSFPLWRPTRDSAVSYGLLMFSLVFMIAATTGSIYSIRKDWSERGPPFSCH